jgi:hypothetical protein
MNMPGFTAEAGIIFRLEIDAHNWRHQRALSPLSMSEVQLAGNGKGQPPGTSTCSDQTSCTACDSQGHQTCKTRTCCTGYPCGPYEPSFQQSCSSCGPCQKHCMYGGVSSTHNC